MSAEGAPAGSSREELREKFARKDFSSEKWAEEEARNRLKNAPAGSREEAPPPDVLPVADAGARAGKEEAPTEGEGIEALRGEMQNAFREARSPGGEGEGIETLREQMKAMLQEADRAREAARASGAPEVNAPDAGVEELKTQIRQIEERDAERTAAAEEEKRKASGRIPVRDEDIAEDVSPGAAGERVGDFPESAFRWSATGTSEKDSDAVNPEVGAYWADMQKESARPAPPVEREAVPPFSGVRDAGGVEIPGEEKQAAPETLPGARAKTAQEIFRKPTAAEASRSRSETALSSEYQERLGRLPERDQSFLGRLRHSLQERWHDTVTAGVMLWASEKWNNWFVRLYEHKLEEPRALKREADHEITAIQREIDLARERGLFTANPGLEEEMGKEIADAEERRARYERKIVYLERMRGSYEKTRDGNIHQVAVHWEEQIASNARVIAGHQESLRDLEGQIKSAEQEKEKFERGIARYQADLEGAVSKSFRKTCEGVVAELKENLGELEPDLDQFHNSRVIKETAIDELMQENDRLQDQVDGVRDRSSEGRKPKKKLKQAAKAVVAESGSDGNARAEESDEKNSEAAKRKEATAVHAERPDAAPEGGLEDNSTPRPFGEYVEKWNKFCIVPLRISVPESEAQQYLTREVALKELEKRLLEEHKESAQFLAISFKSFRARLQEAKK